MKRSRWLTLGVAAATTAMALAACAPPEKDKTDNTTSSGVDAAKATSVADFGTMDDLVKAAQAEGELNVIALPPDWANYGEIITAFSDKYGIKVNS
ncbi:MAG: ABC transporter substrate-binding protein, partial [Mycobacterium sp.]|nr:ABC transporter substrate-binding protein [Mycobacterium sp.]